MKTLGVALLLLAVSCGQGAGERGNEREDAERDEAGEARQRDWWRSAKPCGPGAELFTHIREEDPTMARKLGMAEASNSGILGVFAGDGGAPALVRSAPRDPLLRRTSAFFRSHPPRETEPFENTRAAPALEAWTVWCMDADGLKQGPWSALYDDHSTWINGTYVDDQRHGQFRVFAPTGKLLGSFEMNRGSGEWITWDAEGRVRDRGTYESGRLQGQWRSWHANGKLAAQVTFDQGQPVGQLVQWNVEGQPRIEGAYEQGQKHGRWIQRDDAGKTVREATFDRGSLMPAAP